MFHHRDSLFSSGRSFYLFVGITILYILLLCACPTMAQQSAIYTSPDASYRKGLDLFDKEKYGAAQNEFLKVIQSGQVQGSELKTNAAYYNALCAMELFNKDAEYLMTSFVREYPESPKAVPACFQIGKLNFRQKKYKTAIAWFEKTDTYYLNDEEAAEYYFKLGYGYFSTGDNDNASKIFYEIVDVDTRYTPAANYYYAHIAYENKNYETSLQRFLKIKDSEAFSPVVPYYVVQIYHYQQKYDELIAYGTPLLDKTNPKNSHEIARLIGNAHYRKANFNEAIKYLEEYQRYSSKFFREDYYQLGYALYMVKDFKRAIPNFEKVVDDNDSISQSAFYHLADCFLKTGNKQSARNSFFFASRLSFDEELQEDALYNYAKLSYELSYQPVAVTTFRKYIASYPGSSRADEARGIIADIFLTTKNYKDALEAIESIKEKNEKVKSAWQRVSYFRGVQLYNDGQYIPAIQHFEKALKNPVDGKIAAQSNYWKGEALYKLGNYDASIKSYHDFVFTPAATNLPVYNLANYNIGYCYFRKQDYSSAQSWFRKYIRFKEDSDKPRYDDALLRIADAFFILRDYNNAADYYSSAIDNKAQAMDYALYQKGIILGIQNKLSEKIATLQILLNNIKNSFYYVNAMYETASAHFQKGENKPALELYTKIINTYPQSSYTGKSLLDIGLIHKNSKEDEKALEVFKQVVQRYPASDASQSALMQIEQIYIDDGKPEDYLAYIKTIPFAAISKSKEDSLVYASAEKKYMKGDCEGSARDFANYLSKYSSGKYLLQANYYKADCDYRTKKYDEALKGYTFVNESERNDFTERSLLKTASVFYFKKDYSQANAMYRRLESAAESRENLVESYIGQMHCNLFLGKTDSAGVYARKLLSQEKISDFQLNEAHLVNGRSLLLTDSVSANALAEFTFVSKHNSEMGAESKYNVALILFRQGNYKESQKAIFELNNQVPSYQYWVAKGFILLADNYIALNDFFQAKHTLKSVLDNYEQHPSDKEDILSLAREKLNILIQREDEQRRIELLEKEKLNQPVQPDTLQEGGGKRE